MPTRTAQPLSFAEVRRLAADHDTVLLRATRDADLETPIGAFLALDDGSPAYLLESVEGGERLGRYSFIGTLPRRLIEIRNGVATTRSRAVGAEDSSDFTAEIEPAPDLLAALRRFMPRRRVAPLGDSPRFSGGAVGTLAYDAVSAFEPRVPLPPVDPVAVPTAAFLETDLVIVFDHLTHTLSAIASLHTDGTDLARRYDVAERAIHEALERTAGTSAARLAHASGRAPGAARHAQTNGAPDVSLDRDAYVRAVEIAQGAIRDGEAIQVVVARRQSMPATTAAGGALTGIDLYRALRRVSPSPYLFFVRMPDFEVVGASPELLLRVEGKRAVTHPIAGTRPRGSTPAEDRRLATELAADRKERAEHVMLVDLARNDLGRVARAGSVEVSSYLEVERFSHVQHLVSHVEAELRPECDGLDALRSVFPAGTLSGAPKVRAMQLIAELEGERRGIYGGAAGYLGYDGSLDTAIVIRSAVLSHRQIHIHTGAGIVARSVPELEYEETVQKAQSILRGIEMATGQQRTIGETDTPQVPGAPAGDAVTAGGSGT